LAKARRLKLAQALLCHVHVIIVTRTKDNVGTASSILEHLQPFEPPGENLDITNAELDVKRTWGAIFS
jgi:hypothetical protein